MDATIQAILPKKMPNQRKKVPTMMMDATIQANSPNECAQSKEEGASYEDGCHNPSNLPK